MDASSLRGTEPLDPYRSMEDNASPPVQAWLEEQAARADEYFQRQPVRARLREEFQALYALDTVGLPYPYKGRYFLSRRRGDQDLNVLYVQDGLTGEPRVVIDQNTLSPDRSVKLACWAPTEDGRLMAYGLSASGNDKHDLRVKDVATGADLPDLIPDDFYPSFASWNADDTGFWYTKHDPREPMEEAKLHQRLYFHALGAAWQDDSIVYGEGLDKEAHLDVNLSENGRFLLLSIYGQDKETDLEWYELYLRDLTNPTGGFVLVVERCPNAKPSGDMHRGRLYVTTDKDAPNQRVYALEMARAVSGDLIPVEIIAEGRHSIASVTIVADRIFVETLEDVHSVVREYDLDGRFVRDFPLPTIGTMSGISCEDEGRELFFSFESFALPSTVYRLDLKTNERTVIARNNAGFDTDLIETDQLWFESKDGTRVPMFVIHQRGLVLNGDNPTVLYGYGGFNISLTPDFDKSIVPFLKRGGVYAIANLRGGGEFGEAWHEAGMKTNKQNVFDDFAAAARHLIACGYTCSERLAINGASNGGLLTLATVTQNPRLVAAAVSGVPVADMLRFHVHFGGVYWIPDYGDPDDAEMRQYLLGYSPYHNVRDGERYPAILIATSDGDDRVHPMHSYKMAARLLEANASDQPIYLRVELKAGHGGASAISKYVEYAADEWSFIFDRLGLTE